MVGSPAWSQTAAARIPHRPPGVRLWWYRCPPGMPGLGSPRAGSRPPGRAGGLPSPELHPLGSSMTPYVRPEPNRSSWNTLPPPWAPFMVGSMPLGYPRFGPAEGRAAPPRADWWASTAVAPLPRAAYDPLRPSKTKPQQLAYPTAPSGSVYGGVDAPRVCPIWDRRGPDPAARSGLVGSHRGSATPQGHLRPAAPIAKKNTTAGIPYRPPGLRLW